jgi:hypothetical protein
MLFGKEEMPDKKRQPENIMREELGYVKNQINRW